MSEIPLRPRDIDWLSFNARVLQEAKDQSNPLYERLKFLAIFSSNLDEYFKVQVSQLRQIKKIDKSLRQELALKPNKTLKKILKIVKAQQKEFGNIFFEQLIPQLKSNGIDLITHEELNTFDGSKITSYYKAYIANKVKPQIITSLDKQKVFLKNEALYVFVDFGDEDEFGLINMPSEIERFAIFEKPDQTFAILFIDDIIKFHIKDLFKNKNCKAAYEIKMSRDAELYIEDEFEGNLKDKILDSLSKRETGQATRLLYDHHLPKPQLNFLKHYFNLGKVDLMPGGQYHNFKNFFDFPDPTDNEALHNKPLKPIPHKILSHTNDVFQAIQQKDHLVHYPYMSFDAVENFVQQAADDDKVIEIKISLYRVAKTSQLTTSLLKALSHGKKVTVFIEAKARFDKQNNLEWGKRFEQKGATVIYSYPKIKIHSKILCVSRQEQETIKHYAYIGTGNFNAKTSKLYCDHGLFTADKKITKELFRVFQVIEGELIIPKVKKLLVSPFNIRKRFDKLIQKEIDHAKLGKPAKIIAKMNSLEDEYIIKLLYKASQSGVEVRLIIRGFCCLIPGLDGVSENIKVTSIVDRFLEHGRIYHFHNDGEEKTFIGSADWMTRNLDRRIEVLSPIKDIALQQELKDILHIQTSDNVKARHIDADRQNLYVEKKENQPQIRSQIALYEYLKQKHSE